MADDQVGVDFGMERRYVFDVLTSDISVADCILDLIDNSVDAARRHIAYKKHGKKGAVGLPESYKGYEIDLKISEDAVEIEDNCQGMGEHLLVENAFRLGTRHIQKYSIGIYGVGLVRAFWKLGNEGFLLTDTGTEAFQLDFTKAEILAHDHPVVPADRQATTGNCLNRLVISNLTEDAKYDVSDSGWRNILEDKIRRVFGLCIRKFLTIRVDGTKILEFGPRIRQDITALKDSRSLKTKDGVQVELHTGVHEGYLFSGEDGHSTAANKKLTNEFGWYVVCNDRIVLIAEKSLKVGWSKVWHSEYNGFIGWAYFTGENAKFLPWDSSKTDISLEKRSQREIAPFLAEMADTYRKINRDFRYEEFSGKKESTDGGGGGKKKPKKNKPSHTKDSDFVMLECHIVTTDKKVNDLVHEAQGLSIIDHPYSAALMLRCVTESIVLDYLYRTKQYEKCLKDYCAGIDARRTKLVPPKALLTDDQKSDIAPTLRDILTWMEKNIGIFPSGVQKTNRRHLQRFLKDLKELNGITHEHGILTDPGRIKTFRGNVSPLLDYLLGNPAK